MTSFGEYTVTDVSVTLPDPSVSGLSHQGRTVGADLGNPVLAVLGINKGSLPASGG